MSASVHGADDFRSTAAGTLDLAGSWSTGPAVDAGPGTVPSTGDVGVWDTGSVATGALNSNLSWAGVRVAAGEGAAVNISGATSLTLGGSGIDLSLASQNLAITTSGGLVLGSGQTWAVSSGRALAISSAITGTSTAVLFNGPGVLGLTSGASTWTGGLTVGASGTLLLGSNSAVTAPNAVATSPLGIGTLTLGNSSTLGSGAISGTAVNGSASGRDIANDLTLTGNITLGTATLVGTTAASGRIRTAGSWDLGGATRTVTLGAAGSATLGTDAFGFITQGTAPNNKSFQLLNGTLNLVGGASTTIAAPANVEIAPASGVPLNFVNNSGLEIGNNVRAYLVSSAVAAGANSPTLTVDSGGIMALQKTTTTASMTIHSLAGVGLVTSGGNVAAASPGTSILTIDGGSGTTTFSGTLSDGVNAADLVTAANQPKLQITKNGASTLILTGTSAFSGNTALSGGGRLQVDGTLNANALTSLASPISLSGAGTTLAGSGTINGTVSIGAGTLAPGGDASGNNTIGNLKIINTATLGSTSVSNFDINDQTSARDQLTSVTALTYGGTLNVADLGNSTGYSNNQQFDLFDFTSQSGTFSTVTLPSLPVGFTWHVFNNALANNAGDVDYANGLIQVDAVPEPATLTLFGLGAVSLLARRRRRQA